MPPTVRSRCLKRKSPLHVECYILYKMSSPSAKKKWLIARQNSRFSDPATCIRSVQQYPSLGSFYALKAKLCGSSSEWMVEFLELGGMEVLLEALEALSSGPQPLAATVQQLECTRCIKEILNCRAGLDFMADRCHFTRRLGRGTSLKSLQIPFMSYDIGEIVNFYRR